MKTSHLKCVAVFVILLTSVVLSHADLLIYTVTHSQTLLGNGSTQRFSSTGYAVVDNETGEFQVIETYTLNRVKYFQRAAPLVTFLTGQSGPDQTFTSFFGIYQDDMGNGSVWGGYGPNTILGVNLETTYKAPRVLTGTLQSVWASGSILTGTWIMSFSPTTTLKANLAGQDATDFISALAAKYQAAGYTESFSLQ